MRRRRPRVPDVRRADADDVGERNLRGESRHVLVGRVQNQFLRCRDLHNPAVSHDGYAARKADGFVKVVVMKTMVLCSIA